MIAEKNSTIQVTGTLEGQTTDMSIDVAAMGHIMDVLTNLYEDPIKAVVREYSTNGYDSHIEAGTPQRPIEVTLPNEMNPYLIVKDYGVGLDGEAISEIYSKYGASTKRDTNDQQGMLGLGCKAGLAYAQQFTLTGTKDGIRTTVSVSRSDSGGGSMTVIDESATDEPNGVEVTIPVSRYDVLQFVDAAQEVYQWWKPGTVLVNGEEPDQFEGTKVDEDIYVIEDRQDYVVMGNVAYPTDLGISMNGYHSLVAFVDIGLVNFTPAREALVANDSRTQTTIKSLQDRIPGLFNSLAQESIDAATTHPEATRKLAEIRRVLPNQYTTGPFTFKGDTVPEKLDAPNAQDRFTQVPHHHGWKQSEHYTPLFIDSGMFVNSLFFYGYEDDKFTAYKKKKLLRYCEETGLNPKHFVLMKDKPKKAQSRWIEADRIIDYTVVKSIKLPRNAKTTTGKISGSYFAWEDVEDGPSSEIIADDIDINKPLFYFVKNRDAVPRMALLNLFYENHSDYTLVELTANREAKFSRDFPTATKAVDEVRRLYKEWGKTITPVQLEALTIQDARNGLTVFDHTKIDDPALKRAVRLAKRDLTKLTKERTIFTKLLSVATQDTNWTNPLDEYPLVETYFYGGTKAKTMEHNYLYINAVYAAKESK